VTYQYSTVIKLYTVHVDFIHTVLAEDFIYVLTHCTGRIPTLIKIILNIRFFMRSSYL